MKWIKLSLLICCNLFFYDCDAQSSDFQNLNFRIVPVNPINISMANIANGGSPLNQLTSSDSVDVYVVFTFDTLINPIKFNLDFTTDSNNYNQISADFLYDNTQPGPGLSYRRTASSIELGIGRYAMSSFFIRINYVDQIQQISPYALSQYIH